MNLLINILRAAWTLYLATVVILWPAMTGADTVTNALSDPIRKRLEAASESPVISCGSIVTYAPAVLQALYRARAFQSAWIGNEGPLPQVDAFMNAIRRLEQDGLKPEDYHLSAINALVSEWRINRANNLPFPIDRQIDLEFLLTDALVASGFHLLNGRIDPNKLYPDLVSYSKDFHLPAVIENILNGGNLEAAFRRLTPQDPLYRDLKSTLAVYMNIAGNGGWPLIPAAPRDLKKKAGRHRYLSLLRQRLLLTGDLLPRESPEQNHDNESLREAVRRFQKRHGLKVDGAIGPETLKKMNVPVEKRIEQIRLNLERLRWLPEKINPRHLLVNITDFKLTVQQDGQVIMDMPIVVGRQDQRTFSFNAKMTYLELNPYWNIPKAIAAKEILPEILKDPDYLAKKKIKVIEYSRPQGKEIDASTVDWSKIRPDRLGYSFRQDPGPGNPLGKIKFMFPNKFEIYLHDTPERHLFRRTRRTFSHGCIRIAKPLELAEYLLKDDKTWSHEKILADIGKGKRQIVNLPSPIDVHIIYLTAWTDPERNVHFRNDVYDGDAILLQALNERPPAINPDDLGPPVKR